MQPYGTRLRSRDFSCQMESITTRIYTGSCTNTFINIKTKVVGLLLGKRIDWGREMRIPDLNDQHVLSEVVPLFEDYSNRCGRGGRRHGTELQPQGLLFRGHHLAFVQLDKRDTQRTGLLSIKQLQRMLLPDPGLRLQNDLSGLKMNLFRNSLLSAEMRDSCISS